MTVTLALKCSDQLKASKGEVQAETPDCSVGMALFLMKTWTRQPLVTDLYMLDLLRLGFNS